MNPSFRIVAPLICEGHGGEVTIYCPHGQGLEAGDRFVTHADRDEYDSPAGTRGGWAEARCSCTCGVQYRLIIANHKGDLVLSLVEDEAATFDSRQASIDLKFDELWIHQ